MSTVILFAGGDPPPIELRDELPSPDFTIAADSGHDIARSFGFVPDVLIGDLDSILDRSAIAPATEIIQHPTDKAATDIELAFEYSLRIQPDRVVTVGGEGGRFDHEVSLLSVVTSDRWASIPEIDWFRADSNLYVVRGTRRIQGDPGSLVSLIPQGGNAHGVSTDGLVWELDGETLFVGSSRGTSNQFKRTEVRISVTRGVLVAIVPAANPP